MHRPRVTPPTRHRIRLPATDAGGGRDQPWERTSDAIRRVPVLCWPADDPVEGLRVGEGADEQDGDLSPLQALVGDRMEELGLGRSDLARGMGYSNVSKGCRRVDELLDDDLLLAVRLRKKLAHGLGLDLEAVDRAIEATAARRRAQHWQEYRASFVPHAVALCERDKPSFMLVFGRAVGQRWMRFPDDLSPVEYTQWALDWLPAEIRGFGKTTGFVVNYTPYAGVEFDEQGNVVRVLQRAYQLHPHNPFRRRLRL